MRDNFIRGILNQCGERGPQGPQGEPGRDGEDGIFWVTYQVTPFQEILDAYNAGKIPAMKVGDKLYTLSVTGKSSGVVKMLFFQCIYRELAVMIIYVSDQNVWNSQVIQWANYQAKLESGINIKTVNGQSLLGSGDIPISGGGGTLYKHHIYIWQPAWEDPEEGTSQEGCDVYVDIISSSSQPVNTRSGLHSLAASGAVCSAHGQFMDAWDSQWKIFNYDGLVDDEYMGFVTSNPWGDSGYTFRAFNEYYYDMTVTDTVTEL